MDKRLKEAILAYEEEKSAKESEDDAIDGDMLNDFL